MRFWWREVAGWLLVVLGLAIFYICFQFLLLQHYVVEAAELGVIGIITFRGGIHLLKVAVAARVCLAVREAPERPGRAETGRPVSAAHPRGSRRERPASGRTGTPARL